MAKEKEIISHREARRLNVTQRSSTSTKPRVSSGLNRGTSPADVRAKVTTFPPSPITEPRLVSPIMRRLRTAVFEAFADALDRPTAISSPRDPFLCWRARAGHVEYLRVETYREPYRGAPGMPLIVRLHINHLLPSRLGKVARQLGVVSDSQVWSERDWKTELSVLPEEALTLVPFLVGHVRAHEEADGSLIPEPALPLLQWHTKPLDWDYAWTKAAWSISDNYDEMVRRKKSRWAVPTPVRVPALPG